MSAGDGRWRVSNYTFRTGYAARAVMNEMDAIQRSMFIYLKLRCHTAPAKRSQTFTPLALCPATHSLWTLHHCGIVWRSILCIAPTYSLELFILTSACSGRQSFRSASSLPKYTVSSSFKIHLRGPSPERAQASSHYSCS